MRAERRIARIDQLALPIAALQGQESVFKTVGIQALSWH